MAARPTNIENITHVPTGAEGGIAPVGGECFKATASGTLKVGDLVYWSAIAGVVTKSVTPGDYASVQAGVVIGGRSTFDTISRDSAAIAAGLTAALTGQEVWVQYTGIAWVIAGGAISGPGSVIPSAVTAGRVALGTTAGQKFGTILDTGAGAGSAIRMHINMS